MISQEEMYLLRYFPKKYIEDPGNFNCGSIALMSNSWVELGTDYTETGSEKDFYEYVEILRKNFPSIVQISDPSLVPKHIRVAGFRLEIGKYCPDFHFIVRVNNTWFHKQGTNAIVPFTVSLNDSWKLGTHDYNSTIFWFTMNKYLTPVDFAELKNKNLMILN